MLQQFFDFLCGNIFRLSGFPACFRFIDIRRYISPYQPFAGPLREFYDRSVSFSKGRSRKQNPGIIRFNIWLYHRSHMKPVLSCGFPHLFYGFCCFVFIPDKNGFEFSGHGQAFQIFKFKRRPDHDSPAVHKCSPYLFLCMLKDIFFLFFVKPALRAGYKKGLGYPDAFSIHLPQILRFHSIAADIFCRYIVKCCNHPVHFSPPKDNSNSLFPSIPGHFQFFIHFF